jgi:hypothetical protein
MSQSMFRPFIFSSGLLFVLASLAADAQVVTAIGQNFTGSTYGSDSQNTPPDANGAIGPDYFMEFINGEAAFYNKTNVDTPIRITDVAFWSQAGVNISSDAVVTDPRVIYDPASGRWFASQVDASATAVDFTHLANNFLLAFSDSADPSGSWHGFIFRADPNTGRFADFPTLGVDASGVYLSGDMLHDSTNVGCGLVSIPKATLLGTTNISSLTWFGVMPYASRGEVLQPAICFDGSSSGNIVSVGNTGITSDPHSNIVTFAVQNAAGPGATLSAPTSLTVGPYAVPFNSDMGYPLFNPVQPDGTTTLQANDARFSAKVYAVGGVLYAVHNTEVNGRVAIRWYRLSAATHALLESGTISDPDLDLYFPSIAANPANVVVIGCNGSSIDTFISCYAYVGATVNGVTTFNSPLLLQSGVASYHDENELITLDLLGEIVDSRWGDYSSMSVDPNDPNRFWTIQMYPSGVDSSSGYDVGIWSTQITEILTAIPKLSLAVSNANAVVSWPGTAITFNLETSTNLVAGGWSVVSSKFSTNNGSVFYQTALTNRARFFRLHQP